MGVNALVTGGAGFIGRHLVRALLREGHEVTAIDNLCTSDPADLEDLLGTPGLSFHRGDIRESSGLAAAATGRRFDEIYHLACPTGVHNLGSMALEMAEACFMGSRNVLELAREHGARALLTSSAEVYGNPQVMPQPESYAGNVDPLGPRKGYEEGKRVAESLFAIHHERFGTRAHICRVFNTYGPGMALFETRVIPAFVRAALQGEPLAVHGDGSQSRCHTYVSDMVDGILAVMRLGKPGRPYNLGSQRQVDVLSLARLVIERTGSSSGIRHVDRPAHDHDQRLPDTSRARTELGWRPAVSLEQGIEATAADFRARLAARAAAMRP
jgi:dTDP-glucose 4,6-dehydratase